jgi:hypothetical protein
MGLFGLLVATPGGVPPIPYLSFRPRALGQQLLQDPREVRAGDLGHLFPLSRKAPASKAMVM